ncbi:MAG TPA: hypothetical protein VMV10_06630 [Pirellulales bacterium]|nr:hypothetical protein [Pirellulales bacterium]
MEARLIRAALLAAAVASLGAGHRTANFIVNAPSEDVARQVGDLAEKYRSDLAVAWLGKSLPNWREPCPITVEVGPHLGAGGATSFVFDRGQVFGWQMTIQGPLDRLLDSVLPHEVTHTIFASHFRQPLPRWADEGACSTVEHRSERIKQQKMLVRFLQTGRGIAFDNMFRMKEYPRDILPLYAQGHSLATFLVAQGGKRKFVEFVGDGLQSRDWRQALVERYRFADLGVLQNTWLDWVKRGSPLPLKPDGDAQLASLSESQPRAEAEKRPRPEPNLIHQAANRDGLRGKLVPLSRPQQTSAGDSPEQGWRRAGESPDSAVAAVFESGEQDSFAGQQAAVVNQAARPQPPQPAQQIILEWNQPSPSERRAAPASQPVRGSVYEGRANQGVMHR